MIYHFPKVALSLCILLITLLLLPHQPALALEVNCVVRQNNTQAKSAPALFANLVGELDAGDLILATKQAENTGIIWLQVSHSWLEEVWVNATLVTDCDWTALPKVGPPGQRPEQAGYAPPVDQRGAGAAGIFLPPSVQVGVDDIHIFDEYLDIMFDPSIKAFEKQVSVQSVRFNIRDGNGDQVYSHRDSTAPYCLFENRTNQNQCENIWYFAQTNYFWPINGRAPLRASNRKIDPNAKYKISIEVKYSDGDNDEWRWEFRTIPPHIPPHELYIRPSLTRSRSGSFSLSVGEIRIQRDTLASNTPAFRNQMVFGLGLFPDLFPPDQQIGTVQFQIVDSQRNQTVFQHTEGFVPYCVFGNSQSATYCDAIWRFADTNYLWPNSDPNADVLSGQAIQYNYDYEVITTLTDANGNFGAEWSFTFEIVESDDSPEPPASDPIPSTLMADVAQISPHNASTLVRDALAFQLRVYDASQGQADGTGIARVKFGLFDPDGKLVWERLERAEPYCLFSNAAGASTCNVLRFDSNTPRWPRGTRIQNGEHTVQATITADDDSTKTFSFFFEIQLATQ